MTDRQPAWLRAALEGGDKQLGELPSARSVPSSERQGLALDGVSASRLNRIDALAERAQRVTMDRVGSSLTELRKATLALQDAEKQGQHVRDEAVARRRGRAVSSAQRMAASQYEEARLVRARHLAELAAETVDERLAADVFEREAYKPLLRLREEAFAREAEQRAKRHAAAEAELEADRRQRDVAEQDQALAQALDAAESAKSAVQRRTQLETGPAGNKTGDSFKRVGLWRRAAAKSVTAALKSDQLADEVGRRGSISRSDISISALGNAGGSGDNGADGSDERGSGDDSELQAAVAATAATAANADAAAAAADAANAAAAATVDATAYSTAQSAADSAAQTAARSAPVEGSRGAVGGLVVEASEEAADEPVLEEPVEPRGPPNPARAARVIAWRNRAAAKAKRRLQEKTAAAAAAGSPSAGAAADEGARSSRVWWSTGRAGQPTASRVPRKPPTIKFVPRTDAELVEEQRAQEKERALLLDAQGFEESAGSVVEALLVRTRNYDAALSAVNLHEGEGGDGGGGDGGDGDGGSGKDQTADHAATSRQLWAKASKSHISDGEAVSEAQRTGDAFLGAVRSAQEASEKVLSASASASGQKDAAAVQAMAAAKKAAWTAGMTGPYKHECKRALGALPPKRASPEIEDKRAHLRAKPVTVKQRKQFQAKASQHQAIAPVVDAAADFFLAAFPPAGSQKGRQPPAYNRIRERERLLLGQEDEGAGVPPR